MRHLVKFKEAVTLRVKWQPRTCRALRVNISLNRALGASLMHLRQHHRPGLRQHQRPSNPVYLR